MDVFKQTNNMLATAWDWNCPNCAKRTRGDGKLLRRYARRKLKQRLSKETHIFA